MEEELPTCKGLLIMGLSTVPQRGSLKGSLKGCLGSTWRKGSNTGRGFRDED